MSKLKEATESLDADDISHLNIMHKQIEAFRSTVQISSMKYIFVKSCVRCKKSEFDDYITNLVLFCSFSCSPGEGAALL